MSDPKSFKELDAMFDNVRGGVNQLMFQPAVPDPTMGLADVSPGTRLLTKLGTLFENQMMEIFTAPPIDPGPPEIIQSNPLFGSW